MKIKITSGLAGQSRTFDPGDIVDIPEPVARDWIKTGVALPVERPTETAMLEPRIEKAIRPSPVSRKAR